MDVVISSGWRNSTSTLSLDVKGESPNAVSTKRGLDVFSRKIDYRECHLVARHAAWDIMARVIHAADDEQEGIQAGRQAMAWLREHETTVC